MNLRSLFVRWKELAKAGLVAFLITTTLALTAYTAYSENQHAVQARNTLCANQHAIIEMQRLFLEEHAALRQQLRQVGIHEHPDPGLLKRLGELIEAGDCDVSQFEEGE